MRNKWTMLRLALTLVSSLMLLCGSLHAQTDKLNVLLIISDDLTSTALSCLIVQQDKTQRAIGN